MRRHRAAIATNAALAIAAGAIVVYAVSAEGYRSHRTDLNDGGIWVTTSERGYFGRVNKPIGQLDGAIFAEQDTDLDIVQDGAGVVGLNLRAGRAYAIETAGLTLSETTASIPSGGQVQMRGGTLANVDPGTGEVWATRFDPQTGKPLVGGIDPSADPLVKAGKGAAMAVTESGTILVTSSDKGTLVTIRPSTSGAASGFTEPTKKALPEAAGAPTAMTAVGEKAVTLDAASGQLAVIGGGSTTLPDTGVLQQSGPSADDVLVGTPGALLSVGLATGETTTVVEGQSGQPAAPVRLGACEYGAWSGGLGSVAVACGSGAPTPQSLGGEASNLVFRVNRGEILLNDRSTGSIWDIDADKPLKIDNWQAFTSKKQIKDKDKDDENQNNADRRPPKAKPDDFGARPGRTSVLHPLDNDSAPEGRLLAIRAVDAPSMPGASVTISPDGQTLQLRVPDDAKGSTSFEYYIDDGRTQSAHATVSVAVRSSGENAQPTLREGYESKPWVVPAGGSLEVPLLSDWRDNVDSDSLLLESATVVGAGAGDTAATARTTATGRVRFTAPPEAANVRVEYAVTDGVGPATTKAINFAVQDKFNTTPVQPTANPDVVSGEVGKPITIRPLANDMPGSDPATPNADLTIGGKIPDQGSARIRTDLNAGTIRFLSDKAGTYFVDYDAAYGSAPTAPGKIRVDVRPAPKNALDPVAMPDTLTIYGQAAGTVDVLANDVDPAGGILVVQNAAAQEKSQIDVSVIDGRWLRIAPRQGRLLPNPQLVRYTVSNGNRTARGEVLVSQRPQPEDNTPVTASDRVIVRAGSAVVTPVLDNDYSPSGDQLSLTDDATELGSGELRVRAPIDVKGDVGRAFIAGRMVRYIAPPDIKERDSFDVLYVAENSAGETAQGRLTVVVVPAKSPNTAPEPPVLEGRVVSGDTVKLKVPGFGVDPDGDPVTVTGIASAPTLGRVVSFGANSLEFQAYPRGVGSEEFTYTVVDTLGAEATGTVRVAVVPVGTPQPPVAVPDQMMIEPGRTAHVDVIANDQIGTTDRIKVELVDAPAGVELESEIGPISIKAPGTVKDDVIEVVYRLDNGLATSTSTVTLTPIEDYNNPPVVYDAYGRTTDSDQVTVDVLAGPNELSGAYDPDGSRTDLRLVEVFADPAIATFEGASVTVTRGPEPRVIPFRVEDADGGSATASVYVPPTGTSRPYVRDDAPIKIDSAKSLRVTLEDYIVNPTGAPLAITGRNRVWASPPVALDARYNGDLAVDLTSRGDYTGPGALLVEVAPTTGKDVRRTILSIPVQIGTDRPELHCPDVPVAVNQVDAIEIDVASVCNVWTQDPAAVAGLTYEAAWDPQVTGVTLTGSGTDTLEVTASGSALSGSEGAITITAGDSEPDTLQIRVEQAPSPSLLPISVPDLKPGSSRTIDLASRFSAGVASPEPRVIEVSRSSGVGVTASADGTKVTLTAPNGVIGHAEFSVSMTDVADENPAPERTVDGTISLDVLDTPSVPGRPIRVGDLESKRINLSWAPSEANGSPIDYYLIKEIKSGVTQRFRTNSGAVKVGQVGKSYAFQVAAHNRVGLSGFSDRSLTAVATTKPGRVPSITQVSRGPNTMKISWGAANPSGSAIESYTITAQGLPTQTVPGTLTSLDLTGLDNNRTYTFKIYSRNKAGLSDIRESAPFQSLGTPLTPTSLRAVDQQLGRDLTTVALDWAATLPEGPGPTTYTAFARVDDGVATAIPGCVRIEVATCLHRNVPYDGSAVNYTVIAYNAPGNQSPASAPVRFEAIGKPANWAAWNWSATGRDNQAQLNYVVPDSRGAQSNVTVLVDGVARPARNGAVGAQSELIDVPTNERSFSVALRVCNENFSRGGCTDSELQQVQAYGPIAERHIFSITPNVSGKSISWSISGTSNGDSVLVQYQSKKQPVREFRPAGPGAFNFTTPTYETDKYGEQTDIFVKISDDNPLGRGEVVRSAVATSNDPPPVTVSVSKGGTCRDGTDQNDPNRPPACMPPGGTGAEPFAPCTEANCAFINVAVSGFVERYACKIHRTGRPDFQFAVDPVANYSSGTYYYYGTGTLPLGPTVWAECGSAQQSGRSVEIAW
ncbi:Ig-like domain-containing protein [Nocardioides sp. InS609-2]|uniref:Ig-like domain-containing protein n=1 Tax=Nocardioides sp. InS609-2 TaxID=2760705 RepID=UPI0020C0A71C|nr:Ig-like domain-containing protein [Nocardioides sp. InS609-2]